MKCPECGLWNRASQPHCIRCGAPLNIDEASHHGWKETLKDGGASTTYLRADEFGMTDQTPEPRDELAKEMQDLKRRKQRGAELQQRLRSELPDPAPDRVIVTEKQAAGKDDGGLSKTIVIEKISESGMRARRESEIRSRVRFLDENGAFVEARSYDPLIPESFRSGEDPLPRRSNRYLPKKKHSALRVFGILLGVLALLGGGFLAVRHFLLPSGNPVMENPPGVVITAGLLDDMAAHPRRGRQHHLCPRAACQLCGQRRVRDPGDSGSYLVRQSGRRAGRNHGRHADTFPEILFRTPDADGPGLLHDRYPAQPAGT